MKFMLFICILLSLINLCKSYPDKYYTNGFTVKLKRKEDLTFVSEKLRERSFVYIEKIVSTYHYYTREDLPKSSTFPYDPPYIERIQDSLKDYVFWIEQAFERVVDPYYTTPQVESTFDILEDEADERNEEDTVHKGYYSRETITPNSISYKSPRPIRVAVADVGFQLDHPALKSSVNKHLSFDFVDNDHTPELNNDIRNDVLGDFSRHGDYLRISHGTMCMGRIAAEQKDGCDAGVAQEAEIVGYRIIRIHYLPWRLSTTIPDIIEAKALIHDLDDIDVMSCSYGAPENAGFVRLSPNVFEALSEGISQGRECRGRIYVHPSGNGNHDNCNTDGYANSIDTITIANVKRDGRLPNNKEICTCTLAAATGDGYVTTSLDSKCTSDFAGSSAATAEAAGIIAEVLQVNYLLSKRDIEHLIVHTASTTFAKTNAWKTNGAGHMYHNQLGFGKLDVDEMKRKSSTWKFLPQKHICRVKNFDNQITFRSSADVLENLSYPITSFSCSGTNNSVRYLEHVQLNISIKCTDIRHVSLSLISPSGTTSNLLTKMIIKNKKFEPFKLHHWTFMSVQFWGEDPEGRWFVQLSKHEYAMLVSCTLDVHELILHGTDEDPTHGGQPQTCEETETENNSDIMVLLFSENTRIRTIKVKELGYTKFTICFTALIIVLLLGVYGYFSVKSWYKRRQKQTVNANPRRRRTVSEGSTNKGFESNVLL